MSILSSTLVPTVDYIGRPEELGELRAHLARAAAGRGGLVLLTGEPGIGKTRTCEQVAAEAQRLAMMTAWGRCWEGPGASPYWPWVQILRSLMVSVPSERLAQWKPSHSATIAALLPEKRPAQGSQDGFDWRLNVFHGVVEILNWASQSAPLLLLLDDLQGADSLSLLLLHFIARGLADAPILIVSAYRDTGLAADSPLAAQIPELVREPVVSSVTLRRLDPIEVEAFVTGTLGEALAPAAIATLHRLTEGNPLFLREYMRALNSGTNLDDVANDRIPLPPGVRNAVRRHVAPLSDGCRSVLRAAAVFGRAFGIVALRDLLGYPDEMLLTKHIDEGLSAGIVQADTTVPGRCRFVHTLVRDALYAELSSVALLRYHHDAGTILASRVGTEANLAQIADHFIAAARRGANPEPAVSWARRAGDRALSQFAYEEAERLYGLGVDVLEHFGPDDHRLHAELLLARGNACNRLGEIERAKQTFERAAQLAQATPSRELLAQAALGYGGPLAFPEGGYIDAPYVALLESAIAQWKGDAHGLHARLLSRLAAALYFSDQSERRRDLCNRALAMARACGDSEALGQVLLAAHAALWGPNPDERLALTDELLWLIARTGDRSLAFAVHHWRYCDLLELGDVAGMENEFQACRALAQELREPAMHGWIEIFRAGRAMWEGRFEECEHLANDTAAMGRWLGNAAPTVHFLQIYHLRTLQGRCDEMLEPMRMIAGLNPAIPAFAIGLAHIHTEAGRLDEARTLAADVVAHLNQYPTDINYVSTLTCLGYVCARIGDAALTQPVYDRMRPFERLSIMIGAGLGYCGPVAYWLGVMAASLRQFEDATQHFERALAAETALGSPPWLANTQYEYAAMLVAKNDIAEQAHAATLLTAAETTADRLGMTGLSGRTRALSASLSAAPAAVQSVAVAASENGHTASVYRREGDFWTIEHEGRTLRLRDSRGLRYLAQLLQHPHREFLVVDLAADVNLATLHGRASNSNGNGNGQCTDTVADRRAIADYKRRLEDARQELCEAENNNDTGRASLLRKEMDALVAQLSSAVGLRGRQRPMSSDLERARSAVSKRIRDTLKRIQEENPQLGRYLAHTVQTGYFCTYAPPPHDQIDWSF